MLVFLTCCFVPGSQVLERIKDPLMTLLSRDHFETAYAVLCHFHLIAQRAPIIFSQVGLVLLGILILVLLGILILVCGPTL